MWFLQKLHLFNCEQLFIFHKSFSVKLSVLQIVVFDFDIQFSPMTTKGGPQESDKDHESSEGSEESESGTQSEGEHNGMTQCILC